MDAELLARTQLNQSKQQIRENNLEKLIMAYSFYEDPDDLCVMDLIDEKHKLIRKLSDGFRWKKVGNQFVNHSCFIPGAKTGEISFVVNRIYRAANGEYTPENTTMSLNHYFANREDFALLSEIERKLNRIYYRHRAEIDEILEDIDHHRIPTNPIVIGSEIRMNYFPSSYIKYCDDTAIAKEKGDLELFSILYGEKGNQILLKWLNRLNDYDESIFALADEFLEEVASFKLLFPQATTLGPLFEFKLLEAISYYSFRGKPFTAACRRHRFDDPKVIEKINE